MSELPAADRGEVQAQGVLPSLSAASRLSCSPLGTTGNSCGLEVFKLIEPTLNGDSGYKRTRSVTSDLL